MARYAPDLVEPSRAANGEPDFLVPNDTVCDRCFLMSTRAGAEDERAGQ